MLAKKYAPRLVQYPCFVQPKLNGVRALFTEGIFQSRDEQIWNKEVLTHLTHQLKDLPSDIVLDGELYLHKTSLQRINSAIAVKRLQPTIFTSQIEYHVYDYINKNKPDLPTWIKQQNLPHFEIFVKSKIKYVPTVCCSDILQAEKAYNTWVTNGYEGMMYRDYSSPYGFTERCGNKENRWKTLLKRKDWLDDWFLIVDCETGEGKYEEVIGSLKMEMCNDNTFWAGSGLSDAERANFVKNPPIGRMAHIKYEMLSDNGTPLKPTIIELQ